MSIPVEFLVAQEVARRVITCSVGKEGEPNRVCLEDRRGDPVDPTCHQLSQGVILELSGSVPLALWTPWGRWRVVGEITGIWRTTVLGGFLCEIQAELYRSQRFEIDVLSDEGYRGPLYSIIRLAGWVLPEPVERIQAQFLDPDQLLDEWNALISDY